MNVQERINELMQDSAFVEAFQAAKTPDEVVSLFGRNGIEVPVEIAQELFETNIQDCELSENALDGVAGGALWATFLTNAYWCAGYLGGRLAGWNKQRSAAYAQKCSYLGGALGGALDLATGV